jgi:hypothetical protein
MKVLVLWNYPFIHMFSVFSNILKNTDAHMQVMKIICQLGENCWLVYSFKFLFSYIPKTQESKEELQRWQINIPLFFSFFSFIAQHMVYFHENRAWILKNSFAWTISAQKTTNSSLLSKTIRSHNKRSKAGWDPRDNRNYSLQTWRYSIVENEKYFTR